MKIVLVLLTLAAAAALFAFCKHQPKFTADNLPSQQLRWGNGGGFAGKETTFTLLNNGQIFKQAMQDTMSEAGKTRRKTAAALFETAASLQSSCFKFDHPGNIYSFLEWRNGDMVQRVTWGDPAFPVDATVKSLYGQLNELLKQK